MSVLREDWRSFNFHVSHDKNAFQDPNPSVNRIKANTKNPWSELKTAKRIWKVSWRPGTEKVRMKKPQVRPKKKSTPLMLIIRRKIDLLLMGLYLFLLLFL